MSNTEGVILLQVADLVIEEQVHKKKFPKSLRLSDLVTKYGGEVDHAKGLQVLFITITKSKQSFCQTFNLEMVENDFIVNSTKRVMILLLTNYQLAVEIILKLGQKNIKINSMNCVIISLLRN